MMWKWLFKADKIAEHYSVSKILACNQIGNILQPVSEPPSERLAHDVLKNRINVPDMDVHVVSHTAAAD